MLSAEQLRAFGRDGFLVVRGFLAESSGAGSRAISASASAASSASCWPITFLAHNQSGNMWNPLRRMVYYRLATADHRQRWAATLTDALLEFEAVRTATTDDESRTCTD